MKQFNYLQCELSLDGEPDFDKKKNKQIPNNMRRYEKTFEENSYRHSHDFFYKVVARPTLLYGSETWVTTKRDMTRLLAAEMRFLRSGDTQN